ncbi:hypothetical protein P6B95_32295 [Streptomyces atratus]|uniref:hypothetical protein n=1 Tax=Streptomyces atratus TaxID=1893 RepID=UPI0016700EB4|nr:hypothetical protein [Streptomyces atratus]WPW31614.1 hypothetical protein P6B95_32295 [Streptomyces atratus]GGT40163.1 hypothetical protein GCM10010207_45390 [Streptomyces atratus]
MPGYIGSGPYCFTNSLAMTLGPNAPAPSVIETLTGSPFGVQLIAGTLPLFDPYGWDPDLGLDAAIDLLGMRCERTDGGTSDEALDQLRAACAHGPVLAGPLDMGLLLYHPGTPAADGGDHFVQVLAVDGDTVLLHDPHGHPYATLPTADFAAAWEAKSVTYTDAPFVMRTRFARERDVTVAEALRDSLPDALRWLAGRDDLAMPPGSLGGAAAVEALASQVAEGLAPGIRAMMAGFGVRVGARRLGDAAACLDLIGLTDCAAVLNRQSRILGGLQHPLVTGDDRTLEAGLRQLAPMYEQLRTALSEAVRP